MNIECKEPPNREAATAIIKTLYGLSIDCQVSTLSYCLGKVIENDMRNYTCKMLKEVSQERLQAYGKLQVVRKELEDEKKSSRLFAYFVLGLAVITLLKKVIEKFID